VLGTINNKSRAIITQFRLQLPVSGDGYIKRGNEKRRESPNIIAANLIAIINYIDLVISNLSLVPIRLM